MPAIPTTAPDLLGAESGDAARLIGNPLQPLEITVSARLATGRIDPRDIQREWAKVASLIRRDGLHPLFLTRGLYRMAALTGATELEFATYSATADLKFTCPDPVAYGEERTLTVPSEGSVSFHVNGTYPAKPTVKAPGAVRGASNVWGLRLDDADFLRVEIATGSGWSNRIEADCQARTCSVNGAATLPTPESDWLELEPGEHVLSNDQGSGSCTVTYIERWLG